MLFENVIVLSEKGLEINNNNKENTYKDIVKYEIENNILLFHSKTCLYMYDTVSSTELSKHDIDNIKMIKMSECGTFGGALTYAKTLHIFDHTNILFKEDSVDSFYLSKEYLIVVKECKICIYKNFELKETIEDVRDVYLRRDKAFFIVRKSKADKPNLIFYDLNTLQNVSIYAFDFIDNLNVKADKYNEHFLLSFAVEHDSSAYYNKPRLYLYSTKTKKLQHIKIAKNPIFYDFIENGMLVIHGEQPCDAVILNYNLTTVKSFPNGTRNRGYFNIHNNLICFAGFDNLNGTIEIYSNELLAKFKVLGASKIMWSKNGSYLIVAITNKLKVDNKVLIYDYFGRLIKSQEYDNLINVDWSGSKEPFVVFEKPAVKNIAVESTYVPPHLRGKTPQKVVKNKVIGKTQAPKAKEKVDVAMLEKELAEIAKLKEKMSKGENLEVKEMNMILKEDEIRKMIETNK